MPRCPESIAERMSRSERITGHSLPRVYRNPTSIWLYPLSYPRHVDREFCWLKSGNATVKGEHALQCPLITCRSCVSRIFRSSPLCRCSSMVELLLPKQAARVRFPSSAPFQQASGHEVVAKGLSLYSGASFTPPCPCCAAPAEPQHQQPR